MKRTVAACLVAFVLAFPLAAAAAPSAAMMAPITAVIADANAGNGPAMDAYFTSDATVVDEFAPYAWTGRGAASRWWATLDVMSEHMGIAHLHAVAGPVTQYNASPAGAYVVVPVTIAFTVKGKAHRETGLWTFVLRRQRSTWKIASVTWAKLSEAG